MTAEDNGPDYHGNGEKFSYGELDKGERCRVSCYQVSEVEHRGHPGVFRSCEMLYAMSVNIRVKSKVKGVLPCLAEFQEVRYNQASSCRKTGACMKWRVRA